MLVERNPTRHLATVTLNRPERLNALDLAGWQQLEETFNALAADETLRCVVLRGAGDRAFCAGADIAEFETERADMEQAKSYGARELAGMRAVAACRHPTVAAIRGACVGGGLDLAACCDLRVCSGDSRFGIPVNRLGLTMSYGELRPFLDLVGPAVAADVLLTGEVFDADRALRLGLVSRVVESHELDATVADVVGRIVTAAPLVNRWHKKFIRRLLDPAPLTDDELAEGYAAFDTRDYRRGYRAFVLKEKPRFVGD